MMRRFECGEERERVIWKEMLGMNEWYK